MEQTPATTAAAETTNRRRFTRRGLLKGAGYLALAGGAAAGSYFAARDCIRMGIVGAGVRGRTLAEIIRKVGYYRFRHGRIVAIADVNLPRAAALRDEHASGADVYSDHRKILGRPGHRRGHRLSARPLARPQARHRRDAGGQGGLLGEAHDQHDSRELRARAESPGKPSPESL